MAVKLYFFFFFCQVKSYFVLAWFLEHWVRLYDTPIHMHLKDISDRSIQSKMFL